jgi:hypothetical protein
MTTLTACAAPCKVGTIYGSVYQNEEIIQEITVYAKNMRTGEIIQNRSYGLTDDYQIQMADFPNCWEVGDTIKLWADRVVDNETYRQEAIFDIPVGFGGSGSLINRDIILPDYETEDNDENNNNNDDSNSGTGPGDGDDNSNGDDGRKYNNFTVYGIVLNSSDESADNATVNLKNENTNDTLIGYTNENGSYSINLKNLEHGWKIYDKIKVNATYKSGYDKEYGRATSFHIYSGIDEKRRDIKMVVIGDGEQIPINETTEDLPQTYEGLKDLYWDTREQLNETYDQIDYLEDSIVNLSEQLEKKQNMTHTDEEIEFLNQRISVLKRNNKDEGDATLPIILVIIIILLMLFIAYDKGYIPIGKNKK